MHADKSKTKLFLTLSLSALIGVHRRFPKSPKILKTREQNRFETADKRRCTQIKAKPTTKSNCF
jgi:hypothetical protein